MLSVLIPASNEEAYLGACLAALLAQRADAALEAEGVEVIVAANGCRDATAAVARGFGSRFAAHGWRLSVLDIPEGGKPNALNRADAAATGPARVYLDADVVCGPNLLTRLRAALATDAPRYATGRLEVAPARSWITRRYADVWTRLPFVRGGAVGAGLFAVNAAGRARWGAFPPVISDDTFARLQFAPSERIEVDAPYVWPMAEGFGALVRVRRRQDAGVAELRRLHPALFANEGKPRLRPAELARILAAAPLGAAVYAAVSAAVRLGRPAADWTRGR